MSNVPATQQQRQPSPRERFLALIRDAAADFAQAAPLSVPKADVQRAIDRVVLSFRAAATSKPEMYECTPPSIARAIALCALTGLMPGGAVPEVDLIPRTSRVKNDRGDWVDGPKELQWQVGWRGYKTLAARAGCLAKAINVYKGDEFVWEEGLDSSLKHKPNQAAQRIVGDVETLEPLVASYVVATYPDGRRDFLVIDRAAILKRRNSSDGWKQYSKGRIKTTPWSEWADEQILKTAMRYAASRGLLLLDDVARYAFDADGADDTSRDDAIDVPVVVAKPQPDLKVITDRGGLDDLERVILTEDPNGDAELLTPEERAAEDAKKASTTTATNPTSTTGRASRKAQDANPTTTATNDLVDAIKRGEAEAGDGNVERIRNGMGIPLTVAAKDIPARFGEEQATNYLHRLSNAADQG